MTLNLEENVSCKNLIWFETKLLRRQRLMSDARRNVRLYSRIKDRKSPLKGSRPSVHHGTNFLVIITSCMGGRHNMLPTRQVDLWPFDLESGARVTWDMGYLYANFNLPRPLCSRLRPDVHDRCKTCHCLMPPALGVGHNNNNQIYIVLYGRDFRSTGRPRPRLQSQPEQPWPRPRCQVTRPRQREKTRKTVMRLCLAA